MVKISLKLVESLDLDRLRRALERPPTAAEVKQAELFLAANGVKRPHVVVWGDGTLPPARR